MNAWLPLAAVLAVNLAVADNSGDSRAESFDVIRFHVCDSALYKKSHGRLVDYVYVPWKGLGSAVLAKDKGHPGCSLLNIGAGSLLIRGNPEELMSALRRHGVKVQLLDMPE